MKDANLKGRVAIVTGGSLGIGKAVAQRLSREGCRVVIAARNVQRVKEAVGEICSSRGHSTGIAVDVSRINDVKRLVRHALQKYRTIDILVCAAGVQEPIGPFDRADIETWIDNIRVNLIGTALCCRYVLPVMLKKGYGKIVIFSGGGATGPRPYFSAYAAAKTGLVRFAETIALETRSHHVDINTVAPGAINTRMVVQILGAGRKKAGRQEYQAARDRLKKGGASMEAAVELVRFLCSRSSDGLTGKLISAVWDDWRFIRKNSIGDAVYTIRRIDGRNFIEVKK